MTCHIYTNTVFPHQFIENNVFCIKGTLYIFLKHKYTHKQEVLVSNKEGNLMFRNHPRNKQQLGFPLIQDDAFI